MLIILGVASISAHLIKLMVSIYQVFSGFTTGRLVGRVKFKLDCYSKAMGTSQIGTGRSWVHVRLVQGEHGIGPKYNHPLHDNWCI